MGLTIDLQIPLAFYVASLSNHVPSKCHQGAPLNLAPFPESIIPPLAKTKYGGDLKPEYFISGYSNTLETMEND